LDAIRIIAKVSIISKVEMALTSGEIAGR